MLPLPSPPRLASTPTGGGLTRVLTRMGWGTTSLSCTCQLFTVSSWRRYRLRQVSSEGEQEGWLCPWVAAVFGLPLPVCLAAHASPLLSVVLPPPTNLNGFPVLRRGAVQLHWTRVNAVISGYQVMFRKADSTPSNSAPFSSYHSLIRGNTSVVISNLAVGERYDFQVKAKLDRTDIAMQAFPSEIVVVETYSGECRSSGWWCTTQRHTLLLH